MGRETANTGGIHEINISKDDRKKWESEDTESTKEFKEALRKWKKEKTNHSQINPPKSVTLDYNKKSHQKSTLKNFNNATKSRAFETVHTGGTYEFHITKEDRQKWEKEET